VLVVVAIGPDGDAEHWRAEAERLAAENARLEAENTSLRSRVVELEGQVAAMSEKVATLAKLVFDTSSEKKPAEPVGGVTVQPLGGTVHHLRQQGAYRREFRPTSPPPSPQGSRPTSSWRRRTACSGPDSQGSSSGWTSWKLRTSP